MHHVRDVTIELSRSEIVPTNYLVWAQYLESSKTRKENEPTTVGPKKLFFQKFSNYVSNRNLKIRQLKIPIID